MNTLSPDNLLSALSWRYATKRFDASRKIPSSDWAALESALCLSPSSFGLQPWKFIVVQDQALRAALKPASWNQPQIEEASHLVVFTAKSVVVRADVERLISEISSARGIPEEALNDYKGMMLGFVESGLSAEKMNEWAIRQCYIALGVLLTSAAVIGIDACPMEGIDPAQYDKLLKLTDYKTAFVATLGYRSPNDKYAELKKVRYPAQELITHM